MASNKKTKATSKGKKTSKRSAQGKKKYKKPSIKRHGNLRLMTASY